MYTEWDAGGSVGIRMSLPGCSPQFLSPTLMLLICSPWRVSCLLVKLISGTIALHPFLLGYFQSVETFSSHLPIHLTNILNGPTVSIKFLSSKTICKQTNEKKNNFYSCWNQLCMMNFKLVVWQTFIDCVRSVWTKLFLPQVKFLSIQPLYLPI